MSALNPLLAREHQMGELPAKVPGHPGTFAFKDGGLIEKGITIVERAGDGHPVHVTAASASALNRMAGQLGWGENAQSQPIAMPHPELQVARRLVCPEIEVASLKCILAAFDALLDSRHHRFTRSEALAEVRAFVNACSSGHTISVAELHRFSLGIQYDRLSQLKVLRERLDGYPEPFEHLLLASGSRATRTVDLLWWVLGVCPFGFRASTKWVDRDFTCAVVNPVLKGSGVTGPFWWDHGDTLCKPTPYRAFVPCNVARAVLGTISAHRCEAWRQAVALVEHTADEYVIGEIAHSARLAVTGSHAVEVSVRRRLERLYAGALLREGNQAIFDRVLQAFLGELPASLRAATVTAEKDADTIDWSVLLALYRQVLKELCHQFGPPGHVTVISETVSDLRI